MINKKYVINCFNPNSSTVCKVFSIDESIHFNTLIETIPELYFTTLKLFSFTRRNYLFTLPHGKWYDYSYHQRKMRRKGRVSFCATHFVNNRHLKAKRHFVYHAGYCHCDRQTDRLYNNWWFTQCCLPGCPCLHHPEPKVHSGEFHTQQAQASGESPPTNQLTPSSHSLLSVLQGNEQTRDFYFAKIKHHHAV